MVEQARAWVMPVVAVGIWLFGLVMLGTQWEGIERAPGVWHDAVSLQRWSLFWGGLFIGAVLVAPWLSRWRQRGLVLLPLLVWLGVELRHGTLAPLAWAVYTLPTVAVWLVGTLVGNLIGHPLARGVKRPGA